MGNSNILYPNGIGDAIGVEMTVALELRKEKVIPERIEVGCEVQLLILIPGNFFKY